MKTSIFLCLAVAACIQLNAQTADSAQIFFKKGTDEASAKRYLVAAKYFDRSIALNPKFIEAYIADGKANLEMRKVDAALGSFTKANQLEPANPVAIKELSSLYFNNRQFEKAIDMAQQCKDCDASDKIIGMSYYELEDYGKAVTGLQKALKKNAADAQANYTLARTYLELEEDKNALPYYQKAVDLDTTKNVWMYELALMYYNMNQYGNALKYFVRSANAGYPKSNDFYENIGFAYLYNNDFENGMKDVSIVLSRKPDNVTLLTDIAQAMYQTKRYEGALEYYQKLLNLNANDAKALYMAGVTFQKMGQKEKGQAMCDKAISMDPSLAEKRQKMGGQFGL